MPRRPRTRFAASFVVVVAASGCSTKAHGPAGSGSGSTAVPGGGSNVGADQLVWRIARGAGDACHTVEDDCPEGVKCNPPAPVRFRCPPSAPAAGRFTITSIDGTVCHLGGTTTVVPCPAVAPPPSPLDAGPGAAVTGDATTAAPPALRRWAISRRGDICAAAEDTCSGAFPPGQPAPPCNPPMPVKLACPPAGVTAIVERAPGACVQIREPNLGPVGAPVPCPR